jgi:CDP-glycerol glycerophosphotransferase (TagB/SpsB family)
MLFRVLNAAAYFLSGFVPRDRNKLMFGAWMGRRYADNPKYLMRYLATHNSTLDLVWCGHEDIRPYLPRDGAVRFVRYGSLSALSEMVTAGACFVTHGFCDLSPFNLFRGATRVYVGHGMAIKHMGSPDRPISNRILMRLRELFRNAGSFDHYVAVSDEHRRKLLHEYTTNNIVPEQILDIGQPRVDFLVKARETGEAARIRERFFASQGLRMSRKLVTYMPTFRDNHENVFSFAALTGEERRSMESILERHDALLVEKTHFRDASITSVSGSDTPTRIRRLDERGIDAQELLLATDLLVTDYSGCYLDYLVLDRPIVHFAYDYNYYLHEDRGLFFELTAVAGGPIATDITQLCACLETDLSRPDSNRHRRDVVRTRYIEFERGHSCRELTRILFEEGSCQPRA